MTTLFEDAKTVFDRAEDEAADLIGAGLRALIREPYGSLRDETDAEFAARLRARLSAGSKF